MKKVASIWLVIVILFSLAPSEALAGCDEILDPVLLGSVDTPDQALGVAVSGSYAYVADRGSGLQVVDISDPASPFIAGAADTPGRAYAVALSGPYAYVADRHEGLVIIDVSDPLAPAIVGSVDTPDKATGVAVSGSYAYIADEHSGLQIIDVSDPYSPFITGSVSTPDLAFGVAIDGAYAYVAARESGLQIVDISDPYAPVIVGSADTPDHAKGVSVSGSYAYVADRHSGLQVIDISNPSAPYVTGSADTPDQALGISVVGSTAYIADHIDGLQIIDVSDPYAPLIIASADTPDKATGVAVVGSYAYIADRAGGLQIVDIANPYLPYIEGLAGSTETLDKAYGVDVLGSYAYVADHLAGMLILDITDVSAPEIVGSVDTPDEALDIVVSGTFAYVADRESGLQVIDITDPYAPGLAGSIDTPGKALGVALSGSYACVADFNSGVQIIDISDPYAPFITGSVGGQRTQGYGIDVSGSYAYVAADKKGLLIIDIADPYNPQIVEQLRTGNYSVDVAVSGSYAYMAEGIDGMTIIDISNPSSPIIVGSVDTPDRALDVAVSGSYAYIADRDAGLQIADASDPSAPFIAGWLDTPDKAMGVSVAGALSYIADNKSGLQIFQLCCTDYFRDEDGDGYGVSGDTLCLYAPSPPYVATQDGDCDDGDVSVNPGATEVCNGIDDECDTFVDADDPDCAGLLTYYQDSDGDAYGNPEISVGACSQPGGYVIDNTDCDDADASAHPGAPEVPYDGIDQDCDGSDLTDVDGDGYDATVAGGNDCDDNSTSIHPGAAEVPYDGIDQDCDGSDLTDVDGDGYDAEIAGGDDCNDNSTSIHPGATEVPYDGIDQDCDGSDLTDVDGDGYDAEIAGGNDCDDNSASIHPGAAEVAYDGIDQDCDGSDLTDVDGDGYDAEIAGGDDCNDNSVSIHPGAGEICDNGVDEDCDGSDLSCNDVDDDGDGYTENEGDCDDADATVNPGEAESTCNGKDDDCNSGTADDPNADGDLISLCSGDCDDNDASNYPGNTEVCDGQDNDCDGLVDADDPGCVGLVTFYQDADSDGYGNAGMSTQACTQPAGYVLDNTDCDDGSASINPGVQEVCNDIDDDCDTLVDADDPDCAGLLTYYQDSDGDGYGDPAVSINACSQPAGYVVDNTDCDDSSASINPGTLEICDDGLDNDCDGLQDYDDPDCGSQTIYVDDDGICPGTGTSGDPYCAIQTAIDNAFNNDTIIVRDGTYTGDLNRGIRFGGKAITLLSENGAEQCIIDCQDGNRAFSFMGGENADSVVSGFTIINGNGNEDGNGGAILCNSSSPTITNCTIRVNSAVFGGAIYCTGASPFIDNCTIKNNKSISNGGGIWCASSSPTITNSGIAGNSAANRGGGIYCGSSSSPTITNCTISGNSATRGGGISCDESSSPTVNCILWENSASSGPEIYLTTNSSLTFNHSNVKGGQSQAYIDGTSTLTWGPGNMVDINPRFVDVTSGDYHLTCYSPCIDAGDPNSDYSSEPEDNGGRVNMGRYGNTPEATSICSRGRASQFFQWVPSFGGTSAPELAPGGINFGNNRVMAQVKDASSNIQLQQVFFTLEFTPISLVVLPNFTGTSASELAMLGRRMSDGSNLADVRDASSDALIMRVYFHAEFVPYDMECAPNFGQTSAPELVTLARRPTDGAIMGSKRDASSRDLLGPRTWFSATFLPVDIEVASDFANTSAPELVSLQRRPTDGAVISEVRDASTNTLLHRTWFDSTYLPLDIEVMPNFGGGSSAPELVMLGKRASDGAVMGEVHDASTGNHISSVMFNSSYNPLDIEVVTGFGASPAPELVVLGFRPTDDAVIGEIRDASTGTLINTVSFDSAYRPKGVEVLPGFANTSAPELAVHGVNPLDGSVIGEVKDASSGTLLQTCTFSSVFEIP